jgi:hypothetical protein
MFEEEQTEKEISFLLEEFGQSKESPFGRNYSFFFDSKFLFFSTFVTNFDSFFFETTKSEIVKSF